MTTTQRTQGKSSRRNVSESSAEQFALPAAAVFGLFSLTNILAALYMPIADCDETFNYWEPTHYLSHGYGLQTWEYSPEFAIRSWTYIALHALTGRAAFSLTGSKLIEFYWIRIVLALTCSYCQTKFFVTISKIFNPRVAIMFMMATLTSPGAFSASAAYLPSSFSMYTNMIGAISFMDWREGPHTASGIMWFAVGGIIGWPFAAVLILPFLVEEVAFTFSTGEWVALIKRCVDGGLRSIGILVLQTIIEAVFYRKIAVIPWNLVAYNVFSGAGKGPDIFGTEPSDFYLRNLLLNFNLWMVLAIASAPVLLLQYVFGKLNRLNLFRSLIFVSPFYLLLTIFSLQAHKEERFMYPAYPFLMLSSAIALHAILGWLGNANPKTLVGKIPSELKFLVVASTILGAVSTGILRTVGTFQAYRAPLVVYRSLSGIQASTNNLSVCVGKEWYRYPNSYFLTDNMRARFVKSEFTGLLPGQFSETTEGGLIPETWLIPDGMNDLNIADPSKYTDISKCEYFVDLKLPSTNPTPKEPDHTADSVTWEKITLDTKQYPDSTTIETKVGRILPATPTYKRMKERLGRYMKTKSYEFP